MMGYFANRISKVDYQQLFLVLLTLIAAVLFGAGIALESRASVAGVLLAAVPVFLILSATGRIQEPLLLAWVGGTLLLTRTFALLGLPSQNLYVTEVTLIGLLAAVAIREFSHRSGTMPPLWLLAPLSFYFMVGAFGLLRGLMNGYGFEALRDSVVVFYALFTLLTWHILDQPAKLSRFTSAFLWFSAVGSAIYVVRKTAWVAGWPVLSSLSHVPAAVSLYASFSLISLAILRSDLGQKRLSTIAAFGQAFTIVAAEVRGVWIGLAAALLFLLLRSDKTLRRSLVRSGLALMVVIPLLIIVWNLVLPVDWFRVLQAEAISMYDFDVETAIKGSGGATRWRMMVWRSLAERISKQPLLGEGFGPPSVPGGDRDVTPHNTYLTILLYMGIVGFLAFVVTNLIFFFKCNQWYHSCEDPYLRHFALAIMTCQVCALVSFVWNPSLESPFVGAVYWVLLGFGARWLEVQQRGHRSAETRDVT